MRQFTWSVMPLIHHVHALCTTRKGPALPLMSRVALGESQILRNPITVWWQLNQCSLVQLFLLLWNIYTIYHFNHWEACNSMVLRRVTMLWPPAPSPSTELLHLSRLKLSVPSTLTLHLLPRLLGPSMLLAVSVNLPIIDITYKWNYTELGLLWLSYFP